MKKWSLFLLFVPTVCLGAGLVNGTLSPAGGGGGIATNLATSSSTGIVQPDNSTITINGSGVISVTGGKGIAIQSGAGNLTTLTNVNLVTQSNSANTGILITNDVPNNVNSTSNVFLDFYGVGSNNNATIEWTGVLGEYGQILMNPAHDGPAGTPATTELEILSQNNISIIYDNGNAGGSGHLQIGGAGTHGYAYMQPASNGFVAPFSTPTQPLYFRTYAVSNGVQLEWDPEITGYWGTGQQGGSNKYESHLILAHDTGYFGQNTSYPSPANALVGIDMYGGTNGSTLYTGTELFGRFGLDTNLIAVDTNGITMVGTNINVTVSNTMAVFGPANSTIDLGGTSSAAPVMFIQNHNMWIGTADGNSSFLVSVDGAGGAGHGLFGAGTWGGMGISKGGFSINPTGGTTIATNGNLFQLTGGQEWVQTNAAPFVGVAGATLHTIALNKGWTNDLGARADLSVLVSLTATSTNIFAFTNTTTGDCYTNTFVDQTVLFSSASGQTLWYMDISPGDIGTFSNYGPTVGATILSAKWHLK